MSDDDLRQATAKVLQPDDAEPALGRAFFTPAPRTPRRGEPRDGRPLHYKVICISMYTDDLERLDAMVDRLKARGLTKANRSALIRWALGSVDVDHVPKGL